jgi:ribosomal protein S27AE
MQHEESSELGYRLEGNYVDVELENVQCPECGDRAIITQTEARGDIQPVPPDRRGECGECGHRADPLAFHHEYKWQQMTEEERTQAEAARDRAADRMAECQYSAHYISSQREP